VWLTAGAAEIGGVDFSAFTGAAGGAALTAVLILLITKQLVLGWVYNELSERHEREMAGKDAEIKELNGRVEKFNEVLQTQIIPALVEANRQTGAYNDEVRIRRLAGGRDGG
jgi:hypothetical protein